MIFTYKKWDTFCKDLAENGNFSISAKDVLNGDLAKSKYIILKHDVETKVKNAYKMSLIEKKYNHFGSYYVQAYLLNDPKNIITLQKMQEMGHEISYHYDVMDFCKGDIEQALIEFKKNIEKFIANKFCIETVCQHGNPVIERFSYASNRDFFRNSAVKTIYPDIADIMVDFKQKANTEFVYFSDAGRQFKLIYDPINNDINKSDDKDIPMKTLSDIKNYNTGENRIISVHPHRWSSSILIYIIQFSVFKIIKITAKILYKIPFMKKIMNKYFYLAKKI